MLLFLNYNKLCKNNKSLITFFFVNLGYVLKIYDKLISLQGMLSSMKV